MNTQLAPLVDWVGYIDWTVREFHSYVTSRGSTYNAYLVRGASATALIDTVKAPYADKLIANVRELAGDKVDYLVCNHAEPDHSGAFPAVVQAFPSAEVVCTAKTKDALTRHYDTSSWRFRLVKEGETLDLGGKTLQFFETPMVHWPESMATWLAEDGILFSMDAFGQHYASAARFDDEADLDEVMQEAKKYYANIVLLYARPVAAALKKLGGLPIKVIAPSHGIIWRSRIPLILEAYSRWHVSQPSRKVVVFYSTMWSSTRRMAEAVAEGVASTGCPFKLFNLEFTTDTDLIPELMDAAGFAVGTPTLNMSLMPRMAAALTYVRGLKPAGKFGFTFGSFGWASKGAEEASRYLSEMQVEQISPPVTVRFAPTDEVLAKCRDLGRAMGERALQIQ
ncbi:MAG: FprA family A-type flavoprotein [Kiritimatiellia bacterium]